MSNVVSEYCNMQGRSLIVYNPTRRCICVLDVGILTVNFGANCFNPQMWSALFKGYSILSKEEFEHKIGEKISYV